MKLLSAFILSVSLGFGGFAHAEERSIPDRDIWLEEAAKLIKAGDFDELEARSKETLGPSMHEDVVELLRPLKLAMKDQEALYIDKISNVKMGETFDNHIYAAYYGNREFLFYTVTFAKLENGWQLWAFDYAETLEGLDPGVN